MNPKDYGMTMTEIRKKLSRWIKILRYSSTLSSQHSTLTLKTFYLNYITIYCIIHFIMKSAGKESAKFNKIRQGQVD